MAPAPTCGIPRSPASPDEWRISVLRRFDTIFRLWSQAEAEDPRHRVWLPCGLLLLPPIALFRIFRCLRADTPLADGCLQQLLLNRHWSTSAGLCFLVFRCTLR